MFDSLKTMQALGSLMKNKDQIAQAARRVGEKLDALRVEGEAGSGACHATVTGKMRVVDVTLEPSLVAGMGADEKTRGLAQTLIAEAVNDANTKAQARAHAIVRAEAEDLGLGDLDLGDLGLGDLDLDTLGGPSGLPGLLG